MSGNENTTKARASEDNNRLIHVSIKHGIVIFKFDKLSRTAFEEYLVYIRKYNGQYPDPLRVLYDFRSAGMPGLAFMELHTEVFDGLEIPDRFRWAHLVDGHIFKQFVKLYLSRLPKTNFENQTFIVEDEAVEWLLRPFDQDLVT